MATVSLIGGGTGLPPTDVLPYPVPTYTPPPATGGGVASGIVDIIRALGEALGGILNPTSVTPVPTTGAWGGSVGGSFTISQDTLVLVAIVGGLAYVLAKN